MPRALTRAVVEKRAWLVRSSRETETAECVSHTVTCQLTVGCFPEMRLSVNSSLCNITECTDRSLEVQPTTHLGCVGEAVASRLLLLLGF